MIRTRLSSSAVAIVLFFTLPGGAFGQGARPRGQFRVEGQAVPRADGVRAPAQAPAPQAEAARPAQPARSAQVPAAPPSRRADFGSATAVPRPEPRVASPQIVGPQVIQPRVVQPRVVQPQVVQPRVQGGGLGDHPAYWPNYRSDYRSYYQPNYQSRYRPNYRSVYRPYYTFRPRLHVGFGLWVGFPVAYPTYFYPYSSYRNDYPYPPPNSYSHSTSIYVVPGSTYVVPQSTYGSSGTASAVGAAGGLSFEITPPEAGIYIDGQYVGMASQFTPDQPPLALAPGRHHVEIRALGFEIVAFDVDILPGQVIPYRGDLQR